MLMYEASRGSSSVSSVSLTFSSSSAKVFGDHNFSNMHTCHGLCDHNDATTTGKLSIEAQYEGGSGKCNVSITHVEPNNSLLHLVHLASITDRQAKKRRVSASSTTSSSPNQFDIATTYEQLKPRLKNKPFQVHRRTSVSSADEARLLEECNMTSQDVELMRQALLPVRGCLISFAPHHGKSNFHRQHTISNK